MTSKERAALEELRRNIVRERLQADCACARSLAAEIAKGLGKLLEAAE